MIAENINLIKQEIGQNVKLVVVSKFRSVAEIEAAYQSGHRVFAENKVQPLLERVEALPKDIEWHLIGHLQTNKVKYITPFIHTIQSVDSMKLLHEINKHAAKDNRVINCLLQIYIASEDTKFGLSREECFEILNNPLLKELKHVHITGLMGMATFTADRHQVETEFRSLKTFFDEIKSQYGIPGFETISMGMSNDYMLAIACGSNMIRVGSKVFES
jgi:hypothetical protein